MKILLIEDHPYKRGEIVKFLQENLVKAEITSKASYISGLKEIILHHHDYDFTLLDISMPNYDISPGESGGDFIPLAGRLILKEMYLREIPIKAIVVTMYENFVDGTHIEALDQSLKQEFADNYMGFVYFSANNNQWKDKLIKLINEITNDTNSSSRRSAL